MINITQKQYAYQFSILRLCREFSELQLWEEKKKTFPPISACTATLQSCKIPHVTFLFQSRDWGCCLLRTCSCCVLCWSPSCSSLHIHQIETNRAAVWSKLADVRTYCLIPGRAVCSRVPSLNQTAALSRSSVLHFVVALKKFSINCCAAHSIFYLSPKEIGLTSCLLCCSFLDGDQ